MADAANVWDIVNAIAQSIGAIGTTGALLVAARAYRRQVDDKRSEQASLVVITRKSPTAIAISNHSSLPISNVVVTRYSGRQYEPDRSVYDTIDPGHCVTVDKPEIYPGDWLDPRRLVSVQFEDSAGRRWTRSGQRLVQRPGVDHYDDL